MLHLIAHWSRPQIVCLIAGLAAIQLLATGRSLAAPALDPMDRVRLTEFYRMNRVLGDSVWPGWTTAPDAVLLVCDSAEFLIDHPKPSGDFSSLGYDSLLSSEVLWRPRTFATNLLATFPAVNGIPTIVIGRAEATERKTSTPWVITLGHEQFHQWQMSQPWYNHAVDSLDLSGGDKTGMWMLNYPFPYDSANVDSMFSGLCRQLSNLLQTENRDSLRTGLRLYLAERKRFQAMLKPADYRYFSFQVWQEGIARYVEWKIIDLAARRYKPSDAFLALPDYRSFEAIAQRYRDNYLKELTLQTLPESRRIAFYPFGSAEGMLLARLLPDWPKRYGEQRFRVERLLETASVTR